MAFLPSRNAGLAAALLGALLGFSTARAAQPKAREAKDSAPILMSRDGGSATWANVGELRAAAEKGDPKAQAQFGEVLLRGEDGVVADKPRAIAMLEKAARAGEASAAFRLGMVFDDGNGVPQDRTRAMAYFRAAAAGGAMEALHNLGAAYASGSGVRRDYAEGLAWLILAKKRGSESPAENAVRAQIQKQRRPELIALAERRAAELEREFAGRKVTDFLPGVDSPAPSPAVPAPIVAPVAPKLAPPAIAPPGIDTPAPPKIAPTTSP